MFTTTELATLRTAYARQVTATAGVDSPALEAAYASVPREHYLGDGPWPIFSWTGYRLTRDADPAWLYADNVVGIDPDRRLNNGHPSSHAIWIAAAAPALGDHVVHVGAGVGYYSAILAHMVGPIGRLTAIEFDPGLAARGAKNLSHLPNAEVIQGDGSQACFDPADVIYVNAGASRPADAWLNGLRDGGRLMLPLTTSTNFADAAPTRLSGAVFRITRRGADYEAAFVGPIAVFPCEGVRDPISDTALAEAFSKGGFNDVKYLRRTDAVAGADCWVKAPGWSLSYR